MDMEDSIFLKALRGEETSRVPIWIMRQAGRHLPEHRALREKEGFERVMKVPELIVEASLQPIRRFNPDAAIIYSDILLPCEAMGVKVTFDETGPHFSEPVRTLQQINDLHEPYSEEEMPYISEAIRILKDELASLGIPLIGFVGGPFTVTAYLIEGKPSRIMGNAKQMMYQETETFHRLARIVTSTLANHLQAQVRAGADVIQVFDTWTGLLSATDFAEFSFPYIQELFDSVEADVPKIYFTVDCGLFLPSLLACKADVISLDWRTDISLAREQIPEEIGIQGNLDPSVLLAGDELIEKKALEILRLMQGRKRFIFNLGHGVLPQTEPNAIARLIEVVKGYQPESS